MSRSGYSDDCDNPQLYRGAVDAAMCGRRGQAFLKDLLAKLDAMPVKRLIQGELEEGGEVCTLGVITRARGIDTSNLKFDKYDEDYIIGQLRGSLNIADAMIREIMWINDEGGPFGPWKEETPERRWVRVHNWVLSQIHDQA